MHGDREYAGLIGVETFYKQVLRDMVGKKIGTVYGGLTLNTRLHSYSCGSHFI